MDECRDLTGFEMTPSVKYSFSNFSFKVCMTGSHGSISDVFLYGMSVSFAKLILSVFDLQNLSQLVSINYDLLLQTGQDSTTKQE